MVVAPARALIQRLGPRVAGPPSRSWSAPATSSTPTCWWSAWSPPGYRREYQVEHRGEVAVRGSIVDVFPSTADVPGPHRPVGRRGRPAHRRSPSPTSARSTTSTRSRSSAAGSSCPTAEVRERAAALSAERPWGREQWERLAEGEIFDGMESWLPWLTDEERLLPDLLGARRPDRAASSPAGCATGPPSCSTRRRRWPTTLAQTWGGATGRGELAPAARAPSTGCWRHAPRRWRRSLAGRRGPGTAGAGATGMASGGSATPRVSPTQLRRPAPARATGRRLRGRRAARPPGWPTLLAERGAAAPRSSTARRAELRRRPGVPLVVGAARPGLRPRRRLGSPCSPRPTSPGGAGPTAGAAAAGPADRGFFDDLAPGDYVVHHQHGVARYGGMVKRAIGGAERDYLLLEYRGGDRLYVPSDQIDALTPYTGGECPSLNRLGGARLAAARARVRAAVREIAQELVVLYRRRLAVARPRLRARHALAARARGSPSPTPRRPTSCRPSTT